MLRTLITVAALAALPFAAAAQDKADDSDKPIVITGHRLSDLKKKLEECLARKCPPDQDIAASTALAEEQFVGGSYQDARGTLKGSLSRNKGQAKGYPVPVANLFRADSRVAAHMGAGDDYRIETFGMVDALKAGLPADDPRILAAGIEVGDMLAQFGQIDAAVQQYRELADRARKLGQFNIEGAARLRVVSLYCALAKQKKQLAVAFLDPARAAARDMSRDTNPLIKPYATAATLLVARTASKDGNGDDAINAMIALYRQQGVGGVRPTLVYQPPMKGLGDYYDGSLKGTDWTLLNGGTLIGQWADISFWVKPDGTVSDVDMLRGGIGALTGPRQASQKFNDVWTVPLIKQIAGRRYAPLDMDANAPGVMRVERYTFTAFLTDTKNSRIQSSGEPRYEMLDLSVDPPATVTAKGS